MIVIDASAALAWLLPSQATSAAWQFLRSTSDQPYVAPFVFDWEVRNVLLAKVQQGALTAADLDEAFDQLATYEVICAEPTPVAAVLPLARVEGLSLFDACYLSMAMEVDVPLASRDGGLLAAATRCGVAAYDLRDLR